MYHWKKLSEVGLQVYKFPAIFYHSKGKCYLVCPTYEIPIGKNQHTDKGNNIDLSFTKGMLIDSLENSEKNADALVIIKNENHMELSDRWIKMAGNTGSHY